MLAFSMGTITWFGLTDMHIIGPHCSPFLFLICSPLWNSWNDLVVVVVMMAFFWFCLGFLDFFTRGCLLYEIIWGAFSCLSRLYNIIFRNSIQLLLSLFLNLLILMIFVSLYSGECYLLILAHAFACRLLRFMGFMMNAYASKFQVSLIWKTMQQIIFYRCWIILRQICWVCIYFTNSLFLTYTRIHSLSLIHSFTHTHTHGAE